MRFPNLQQTAIVDNGDVIDKDNSTVTPLGSNGVFTGKWISCINYSQLHIIVNTDSNSAALGLKIEFSIDGIYVDHTHEYSIVANAEKALNIKVHGSFYRVVYTNSTVSQTRFRLQSVLSPMSAIGTILGLSDNPSSADDALVTKSIIAGTNSVNPNEYLSAKVTPDGGLVINQNIVVDPLNCSTANLAVNAEFLGASVGDLTATGVQYIMYADQNCIVSIEQSPDGTYWDVVDSYNHYASRGSGQTVQLVGSFYRVRVKNVGFATTTQFRLQTILVPLINPLPRSLDNDGYLQVGIKSSTDHYGVQQYYAPNGELVALPLFKLVGDLFFDSSVDPGRWITNAGTGGVNTVTGGQLVMSTGTTANNSVTTDSVHTARFTGLAPNKLRTPLQCPDGGTVNNIREWGVNTTLDGAFFRLDGTTLRLVTRKAGVDTVVASSGAFNGQFGQTFSVGTISHFFEIVYQPRQVVWLADNKIIHTLSATQAPWSETLHLPIRYRNYNVNGSTTNVTLNVRLGVIARFGIPDVQKDGNFTQGLNAGKVIKYGPGILHALNFSGITNNSVVNVYDGLTTAGELIFSTGTMVQNAMPFALSMGDVAFNIGLTISITGAASNVLVLFD